MFFVSILRGFAESSFQKERGKRGSEQQLPPCIQTGRGNWDYMYDMWLREDRNEICYTSIRKCMQVYCSVQFIAMLAIIRIRNLHLDRE